MGFGIRNVESIHRAGSLETRVRGLEMCNFNPVTVQGSPCGDRGIRIVPP
jgi:hypothetical protein